MQNRFLIFIVFVLAIVAAVATTLLVTKNGQNVSVQEASAQTTPAAITGGAVDPKQLEKAVADYITNNPEAVIQALMAAKGKQEEKEAKEAEKNITTKKADIENDAASPTFGAKEGDVVFVKFNDYNCGYCKKVAPDVEALGKGDSKIRFVIKEFPILGDYSVTLAKASISFYRLNPAKFHEFHSALVKATPRSEEQLYQLADSLGVKGDALKAEMAKPEIQKEIEKNLQLGASIGVRGTPAFIIGGEFIRGAVGLDQMKAAVEAARKKKS